MSIEVEDVEFKAFVAEDGRKVGVGIENMGVIVAQLKQPVPLNVWLGIVKESYDLEEAVDILLDGYEGHRCRMGVDLKNATFIPMFQHEIAGDA